MAKAPSPVPIFARLGLATLGVEQCAVLPHDRVSKAPIKTSPGMSRDFVAKRFENLRGFVMKKSRPSFMTVDVLATASHPLSRPRGCE